MYSIGYFYNLHVNIVSFMYSVLSVKKYSPGSPIIAYGDTSLSILSDYKEICRILEVPLYIRVKECTYINKKDEFECNLPKMQEFINRMYCACTKLDTEWVIRMEDDVHLRWPIKQMPDTDAAGNYNHMGMGGGSVFKRDAFITTYEKWGEEWIDKKCRQDNNKAWAGDGLLREFFTENGYTYSKWKEIKEDWFNEDADGAVHHGDKTLYDKEYLKERGLL